MQCVVVTACNLETAILFHYREALIWILLTGTRTICAAKLKS